MHDIAWPYLHACCLTSICDNFGDALNETGHTAGLRFTDPFPLCVAMCWLCVGVAVWMFARQLNHRWRIFPLHIIDCPIAILLIWRQLCVAKGLLSFCSFLYMQLRGLVPILVPRLESSAKAYFNAPISYPLYLFASGSKARASHVKSIAYENAPASLTQSWMHRKEEFGTAPPGLAKKNDLGRGQQKSVPDSTLPVPMVTLCLWLRTGKGCKRYNDIIIRIHQDASGHSYYVTMPRLRFVWPCPMSHNLKVSKLTSPKRRRVCVKLNGWDASWLWPCYHHWRFLGVWQPRPWKWGQTWGQLNPDRWNEWNQEQEHIKLWQNDHNTSIKSIYVTHGKGIPIIKG